MCEQHFAARYRHREGEGQDTQSKAYRYRIYACSKDTSRKERSYRAFVHALAMPLNVQGFLSYNLDDLFQVFSCTQNANAGSSTMVS